MASYTTDAGSKLPNEIMSPHEFKDISNAEASDIAAIKALQDSGDYEAAATYISAAGLSDYMLSASYINLLDEETRNLEILALSKKQQIFYVDTEPTDESDINDVWIA